VVAVNLIILQIIEKFPFSSPLRKLHKLRRQDRRGKQQCIHQPLLPRPLSTHLTSTTLLAVTTTPAMTPTPNNSDDDDTHWLFRSTASLETNRYRAKTSFT